MVSSNPVRGWCERRGSSGLTLVCIVVLFSTRSRVEPIPRTEGNVLFNDPLNTFLLTVIWRQRYGKELFR